MYRNDEHYAMMKKVQGYDDDDKMPRDICTGREKEQINPRERGSPLALEGALVLPRLDLLVLLVQPIRNKAELALRSLEGPVDVGERKGRDGRDGDDERRDLDGSKLLQPFLCDPRPSQGISSCGRREQGGKDLGWGAYLEGVVRRLPVVRRDVVRRVGPAHLAAGDGLRDHPLSRAPGRGDSGLTEGVGKGRHWL